ncbi:hypothetical protein CVT91_04360 [Candidatus Atribacteria bacterium HGW-Atribacteria-1]|nr:MAG: hypothetical protein CVT91_04360 [Candidatus Atribacteria bacterium HGW-Atribacteria-1]
MSQRVSVVRCPDYDLERVETALKKSLNLLGGISRFVKPGQRVCLKANLLLPAGPEQAVTTHPSVIEALVNLVRKAGGKPFVADSPGGGVSYTEEGLRRVYQRTGLLELAERAGVELNWDTTVAQISFPEGKMMKRMDIIKPVLDADVVIAIPKLKTHMFTTFTGATKILFGVIPGLTKTGYHAKLADLEKFAEMLLDIVACVKPALFVMDGVLGMEGDGPGLHGTPREVGLLLVSPDAVALDVVASQVIGIDPGKIPMLQKAKTRGWWDGSLQSIEVAGCPIEEIIIPDFKPPQLSLASYGLGNLTFFQRLLQPFFKPVLTLRPIPQCEKCTACGTCVRSCPQKAISIVRKLAVVDDDKCIRCYCCHELCPEAAIELKSSWLGRLVRRRGAFGSSEMVNIKPGRKRG